MSSLPEAEQRARNEAHMAEVLAQAPPLSERQKAFLRAAFRPHIEAKRQAESE